MKITITGASGFVGTNLTEYLVNKGINVSELSLRSQDWLTNLDKNSNVLIHLAGKAHDLQNSSNDEEYFVVNRDLTLELFQHFLDSNIQSFFYFSSVKAVADTVEDELTEQTLANPFTAYGKSKYEAEKGLLSYNLPEGKKLFIIRPCMIHGPGNKGNLNLLYKIVKKGIPWPLAKFENKRSFLSIDNLSYLIFEMINHQRIKSGIYNFADDNSLSTNQLIQIINGALNRKARLLPIPIKIINMFSKFGDLVNLPLNSERLKKLTENYVVSNQKIKEALEIKKLKISTEEGIIKTIKSFKK